MLKDHNLCERLAQAWSRHLTPDFTLTPEEQEAMDAVMVGLNEGELRVASLEGETWQVHTPIQQAILLYFKTRPMRPMGQEGHEAFDKIPLKFQHFTPEAWERLGIRVVPYATVRYGAFIGTGTILMPCYINIGAYIGKHCLIDTWSTIGSGAQIGDRVHISGGVGIGGILEPLQARPTIIESHAFIGARAEIAEGVHIRQGAVLASGLFLTGSTRLYDRTNGNLFYGEVPEDAVVVPGTLPDSSGTYALQAGIIVKYADQKTRAKLQRNPHLYTEAAACV